MKIKKGGGNNLEKIDKLWPVKKLPSIILIVKSCPLLIFDKMMTFPNIKLPRLAAAARYRCKYS